MNKQFSIYLDLLRLLAAILVFCTHASPFSGGWLWQIALFGHEAVVFFFVLSGFVIAYVCIDKQESFPIYTINRLTRIYSVAIPALIISVVFYYLTNFINPSVLDIISTRNIVVTLATSLTFLNQSWIATPVFSNLPYWSLGYEVLYYVFFGVLFFTRSTKRVLLIVLIFILMGPSILLYLPIWLLGVVCFKSVQKYSLSIFWSGLLWCISVFGILLMLNGKVQHYINDWSEFYLGHVFYSLLLDPAHRFAADYILAFFVALHIFSSSFLGEKISVFNDLCGKIIKKASMHTFSLYLYHMPFLFFVSAIFPPEKHLELALIVCWIIVPFLIFYLSVYTESKKWQYKLFFQNIFVKLNMYKVK